jgi:hypothetical protein
MPQEFTKVDGIIDLVFTATNEIRSDELEEADEDERKDPEKNFRLHRRLVCGLKRVSPE